MHPCYGLQDVVHGRDAAPLRIHSCLWRQLSQVFLAHYSDIQGTCLAREVFHIQSAIGNDRQVDMEARSRGEPGHGRGDPPTS